nr:hypothetical protein Iba_chr12aCG1720 [Ipomoea batatas]
MNSISGGGFTTQILAGCAATSTTVTHRPRPDTAQTLPLSTAILSAPFRYSDDSITSSQLSSSALYLFNEPIASSTISNTFGFPVEAAIDDDGEAIDEEGERRA